MADQGDVQQLKEIKQNICYQEIWNKNASVPKTRTKHIKG